MRCLTLDEAARWLENLNMPFEPYGQPLPKGCRYFQFACPADMWQSMHLIRSFIGNDDAINPQSSFDGTFGKFDGALFIIKEWIWYPPDQTAIFSALRRGEGEVRHFDDAPAHLFDASEQGILIGYCYLALMYNWTAYLYLASKKAILLFWEGELIDFWSFDDQSFNETETFLATQSIPHKTAVSA